jgi:hypothetical protein
MWVSVHATARKKVVGCVVLPALGAAAFFTCLCLIVCAPKRTSYPAWPCLPLWNLAAGATAKAKGRKREDFSKGQQQNMQAELRGVLSEEDAAAAGAVNGFMMAVPVPAGPHLSSPCQ